MNLQSVTNRNLNLYENFGSNRVQQLAWTKYSHPWCMREREREISCNVNKLIEMDTSQEVCKPYLFPASILYQFTFYFLHYHVIQNIYFVLYPYIKWMYPTIIRGWSTTWWVKSRASIGKSGLLFPLHQPALATLYMNWSWKKHKIVFHCL